MQPKEGFRVRLLQDMDDPYAELNAGEEGTIKFVDDAGHIHVAWDNGSNLSVLPEIDSYEIFDLKKGLLDFTGMTKEQIEIFLESTKIGYEIDGNIETSIDTNGHIHEESIGNVQSTNWLTGTILNLEVGSNIGLEAEDAYLEALRFYKQANYDLEAAADDFDTKYGPLL